MKTQRILAVLVAVLIISSAVYAGPKPSPQPHGATWGGNSAVSVNHGAQGFTYRSFVEYMKSLVKGIGFVVDGAVWG